MPVKPIADISDPRYVKALSHPLRVRILALLEERTASPRELADWLDATLGTVSYHVRALDQAGLLELVDTTQVRGAVAHHYRARLRPRASAQAWAAAPPIAKQADVGAALQTIDEYARASAAAGGFDRTEAQLSRTNLRLDDKGWQQAAKACDALLAKLTAIEQAAGKRSSKDPDEPGVPDAAIALLLFETVKLTSRTGSGRERPSRPGADATPPTPPTPTPTSTPTAAG
jgi:DNA-binding transcriptional ArsR family regulator